MAPRLVLSPSIIKARQLYYEPDIRTGGSVIGRNTEHAAQKLSVRRPKRRLFVDASPEVQKIIGNRFDFEGAPPESRSRASWIAAHAPPVAGRPRMPGTVEDAAEVNEDVADDDEHHARADGVPVEIVP